jgi:lipopolysaccharide transport system permease protein
VWIAVATAETQAPEPEVIVIRSKRGWRGFSFAELWEYRELLAFLTWRNVLVRYKQTALGIAWAVLQPFTMMVVFSLIFGRLAKIPSNGVPYPIFTFAALLPWTFFASALTQSAMSVVGNANLIGKVYFPRLALPLSAIFTAFVDFLIASVILFGMMAWYGTWPNWIGLAILPGLLVLAFATALGVGLWLAAINVVFRDVQYVMPFLIQLWFFATPVVYSATLVGEPWRTLFGLNPMAGVVEGFRWALLDAGPAPGWTILLSAVVSIVLLTSGALNFRRVERTFADVV